jgi:hypothetical protein
VLDLVVLCLPFHAGGNYNYLSEQNKLACSCNKSNLSVSPCTLRNLRVMSNLSGSDCPLSLDISWLV